MHLIIVKIILAVSIFLLTLVSGFWPLKIFKHDFKFFNWGDAFASGVFLSAALLHLLPEASEKLGAFYNYPLAGLICVSTCILLLIIERGIFIYNNSYFANNKQLVPIFLILLLSIHSLVEGAAIGINSNFIETFTIFFAVLAHKGSESFALTVNLHHFGIEKNRIKQIITIFSFITPIGIFISSYIVYMLSSYTGATISAYFNATAAGTFLYLGTEHLIEGKKSFENISEIMALICGVALMALVALWV
jgi:solute carrier family 39 (zinc transporter), member 1/2/3